MPARSRHASEGLSLVEVVIAMLILGLIAIALIPPLWQGIELSSKQSYVATATRQLNALVEEMRDDPMCGTLNAAAAETLFRDGAVVTSGEYDFKTEDAAFSCTAPGLRPLELTATDMSGTVLATVSARIYAEGP